jgi:outer membrane protein OmpA-like peptidoglycan-associated protein/tetratricopeptide (TPR) repeat protein
MRKLLFFSIVVLCTMNSPLLFAQEKVTFKQEYIVSAHERELQEEADFFYGQKDYLRALPVYKKLYELYPGGTGYGYRLGICYIWKTDEREKAVQLIEAAQKGGEEDPDLLFYLGRAYHINYRFDDAIACFSKYLEGSESKQQEQQAKTYIGYCNFGKALVKDPQKMTIRNLGATVNSEHSEYVPVISGDGSVMIFTYRGVRSMGGLQNGKLEPDSSGEFYEDVFVSYKIGNTWTKPEALSNINTNGHDASIALSPDGSKLFLYKSTMKDKGDVYMSTLKGDKWSDPVKLEGEVNTNDWEGSVSITGNGRVLYFSSDRPGGYGGKDIYKAQLMSDGTWGKTENLGPVVNTKFDEDAPFIHADGRILHFSSTGHEGMGGYDIFVTRMEGKGYTKPQNIGFPVNSTADDIYYVINAEGTEGFYASTNKGGYGQQDIYLVNPGLSHGRKPLLMLVKGKVTVDGKPTDARITVKIKGDDRIEGEAKTNSATGEYSTPLPAGYEYSIAYDVKGFSTHMENVDASKIDTFTEKVINVELGTPVVAKVIEPVPVVVNKLKVQKVFFDFDEYGLDPAYTAYADNIVNILSQNKDFTVEVSGNTDNKGTDEYNYSLSRLRAQTIANYLFSKGISRSRVKLVFNGESKPIAANQNADGTDNEDGRAKNRRVEFLINTGSVNTDIEYENNSPVKAIYSIAQTSEENP